MEERDSIVQAVCLVDDDGVGGFVYSSLNGVESRDGVLVCSMAYSGVLIFVFCVASLLSGAVGGLL